MTPEMIKACKVKDLKVGDFFLRGRLLYRMSTVVNNNLQAQRCLIATFNKIELKQEQKVDRDSEVTLVSLPETCQII